MHGAVTGESRGVLRSAALSRRNSLSPADCIFKSRLIQAQAIELPQYLAARAVALYSPIQNEVDTSEILGHALACGRKVFYPKAGEGNEAGFYQISSSDALAAGRFGIPEPDGAHPLSDIDRNNLVAFVPGLLFDGRGNRLGRGGGWYDRMLARLDNQGVFVGLAYEFQVVAKLAAEKWDCKIHFVITENRVIDCRFGLP
jgi:5-formyltetrahydrofolate cyclo-ligase